MGLISKLLRHASDLTPEQARRELDGILLSEASKELRRGEPELLTKRASREIVRLP